ncbi:hypothetical protein M3Y98_00018600 [Aphelenchoides besseyi]|nr:hypothetical protein M3Y98_00018600 [Aphelenchoides besseyi]
MLKEFQKKKLDYSSRYCQFHNCNVSFRLYCYAVVHEIRFGSHCVNAHLVGSGFWSSTNCPTHNEHFCSKDYQAR